MDPDAPNKGDGAGLAANDAVESCSFPRLLACFLTPLPVRTTRKAYYKRFMGT